MREAALRACEAATLRASAAAPGRSRPRITVLTTCDGVEATDGGCPAGRDVVVSVDH